MPKDGCPPCLPHIKMPRSRLPGETIMRRWMMLGITAAFATATAHAQSAPQASDSWERPAASSSITYGSNPAATSRDSHSAFRFKDDDKTYDPRFRISSRPSSRNNGRPQSACEANPTSSTCRQAQAPRPGEGL